MTGGETSPTELLAELQRVADHLDRTPSMQNMTEYGDYSPSTYQSQFGTWNTAVTEAGLTPNSRRNPRYTDEELLADLQELATDRDRVPTKADMREHGSHSPSTYGERFGGWREALTEAGLTPDHRGTKIPQEELLDALETLAASLGHPPTATEMDEAGAFSSATYYRRFDSWDAALDAADLSSTASPTTTRLSDQELLDEIARIADVLHRPPTTTEMDELGAYSVSTYRRRFDSWETALSEAGVEPTDSRQGTSHRISNQKLRDELRALTTDLGHPPTAQEMWEHGSHSPATYLDRYETWNAALEAAGLDPRRSRKAGIRTRNLIRALRAVAQTRGQCPQRQEMDDHGPFAGMTYYNRFGSWQAALDAAGLESTSEADQAVVQGYCTVCCERLTEPVSDLAPDGRMYCTTDCTKIYGTGTIHFEDDIVAEQSTDNQVLGRFAALLHNLETYVPDVILYLRHAISLKRAGFHSATTENHQITQCDNTIEVTPQTESRQFQVNVETLANVEDLIAQVTDQTATVSSLVSSGTDRRNSDQDTYALPTE